LGRSDEARACFERALAAQPDHPIALINLAEALRQQEQLDEARLRYEQMLALTPTDLTALRGLAAVHQTQQRPTEAAELLGRLVALTPDDPRAHDAYARELNAAGQAVQAAQAALAGLDRCPGDVSLARRLVDLLLPVDTYDTGPTLRAALLTL